MRSYLSLILVLLSGLFVIANISGCAPAPEVQTVVGPPGAPGGTGPRGPAGRDGNGCYVTQIQPGTLLFYGGAIVQCGDVSVLISNGRPGFNGADGQDGEDGAPGVDAISEIINPCGSPGRDGADGADGANSVSQYIPCTSERIEGGAILTCGETSVEVLDGVDGAPGTTTVVYCSDKKKSCEH